MSFISHTYQIRTQFLIIQSTDLRREGEKKKEFEKGLAIQKEHENVY